MTLAVSNLPSHSHYFTSNGTISGGSYSFSGTAGTVNVSGGSHRHNLSHNVSSWEYSWDAPTPRSIRELSFGDYTNIIFIDTYHTEYSGNLSMSGSFTPQGSVSVSSNPTFSGTRSTTENSGSGQSFSIMNPYVVKYCWERTA